MIPRSVDQNRFTDAAHRLARCQRLLVLTGAGMSADAGVPTFRCEGGLWRTHRVEDLAHPDGFQRDPDLVWEWYRERRLLVSTCSPHPGQRTIALLQNHFRDSGRMLVATTNEDDLLERAGVTDVVHLHGSLFDTACAGDPGGEPCGWVAHDDQDNSLSMVSCPRCGARVRPGSVWYGEALPRPQLDAVAAFHPDGCLLIGSSCLVQPVASIPSDLVAAGLPVVEINPEETPFSPVATVGLRATAMVALPRLVDLITSHTVRDQRRRLT